MKTLNNHQKKGSKIAKAEFLIKFSCFGAKTFEILPSIGSEPNTNVIGRRVIGEIFLYTTVPLYIQGDKISDLSNNRKKVIKIN